MSGTPKPTPRPTPKVRSKPKPLSLYKRAARDPPAPSPPHRTAPVSDTR